MTNLTDVEFEKMCHVAKEQLYFVTDGDKLALYGFYKVGTLGKCTDISTFSGIHSRLKHKAWKSASEACRENKMIGKQEYIKKVKQLLSNTKSMPVSSEATVTF